MSHADPNANNVKHLFRPASYYYSPEDVLNDATLSTDEKRVILSSWASDMYVVESHPALREVPGIPRRLRLDDILAALKALSAHGDTELVTVKDSENTVRIWVDSKNVAD